MSFRINRFYTLLKCTLFIFIVNIGSIRTTDCAGGSKSETISCCSSDSRCGIYQGDCDNDNECEDGLSCGTNNCPEAFEWSHADCCQKGKFHLLKYFVEGRIYVKTHLQR